MTPNIGNETLSGKRWDKHLTQAIRILKARGLTLSWAEYLADDPARMWNLVSLKFLNQKPHSHHSVLWPVNNVL